MSDTSLWLAPASVERIDIATFADERGLDPVGDPPWTGGVRQSTWASDEAQLTFAAHAPSGKGLFVVACADEGLAEDLRDRFSLWSPDEVMAAAAKARGRAELVASAYSVGALLLATHRDPHQELSLLCAWLTHDDRHVRFAAARILRGWPRREVVEAMQCAAKVHGEMQALADHLERQHQAAEAGILDDHPTDDEQELIRRARAGLEEGKPARIERATDMLFEECLDHPEGLVLRAHFHAINGQPMLALGLAGAAREAIADEAEVRDDDDTDDLVTLTAELHALTQSLANATPEEGVEDAVQSWLARFEDEDAPGQVYGMARALIEPLKGLRPLMCFLAGRYDDDVERLAEAVALAPDSPPARRALGVVLSETSPAEAEVELREALRLLDRDAEPSEAAQLIERFEPTTPGEVLDVLTPMVYEQERYEEAGELADAQVVASPKSAVAWQIRANARTFSGRHQEAADLYLETLEALDAILDGDGIMLGEDPRPSMHFNRACVLSKVGARDEALDELRHAVRADARWAERAVEDDYFGVLLEDETFKRIVAREPRALVPAEELEEGAVAECLERALGLEHRGDVEAALETVEAAAERARWGGHGSLELRAMALRGRILAMERDRGAGLEMLERAVAGLDADTPAEVRIEVVHAHGMALQLNGRLDAAEAAYQQALDARRAHSGEAHPLLAKSLGDLANIASLKGDEETALRLRREAVALLEAHLENDEAAQDAMETRVEALTDLATLRANLGYGALRADEWAEALGEATEATEAVEKLLAMGFQHGAAFMDNLAGLLSELGRVAPDEPSARVAAVVEMRVEGIGLDARPPVREEQVFWRRLRRFAARMRREGVSDEVLTETFTNALRGPEHLPEALRAVPELGGFAHALAQRAAAVPTFLVLAPMALETARADGRLDDALEQLEGLCLSHVVEGLR